MAQYHLQLLSAFRMLDGDGRPINGFRTNKSRALLAYLGVEARPHSRDYLAGLLWPEWPDEAARTYLRQALANLHRVLDDRHAGQPFLLADRHFVQISPAASLEVDANALMHALSILAARRGSGDADHLARLEQALATYRGEFMQGFALDGCEAFEEWQLLTGEHIRREVLDALGFLADRYTERGDYARARQHAWQRVSLEPWLEEGHRQVMELLSLGGEPAAALAYYEQYRRRLAAELGVSPAAETVALCERIRRDGARGAPPRAAPRERQPAETFAPGDASHRRFVAREPEMASLTEHLANALDGRGRVAFISGDAGQGKTTLTYEFARAAQAEHASLLAAGGRCSPQGDSLLPFREMLSQLTGDVEAQVVAGGVTRAGAYRLWSALPGTVDTLLGHGPDLIGTLVNGRSLAERSSLLPGDSEAWQGRIEALAARNEKRTAGSQVAVFDQFRAVVQQISLRQPLLLWVEDLHWADADSLALLFHLGQRLAEMRVLLIGTYRPEEIDLGGRGALTAGRMLRELTRTHGAVTVDLGQADGRRFVDAYVDTEPNRLDAGFRAALCRASGGHPLFTVELLRDLQANGTLRRDPDGRWIEAGQVELRALPARVDAAIGQRIARLPRELHALLSAASVQGEAFAAEVASAVLGVPADAAVEHLSEEAQRQHQLVQAEGIRHIGDRRVRQYRFRHVLLQRYLYDRLDPVERAQWHEDTAASLERLYAPEPDALAEASSQLARHYEAAGLEEQAIMHLQVAGERALRISAETDAISYFNRGLALLQSLPEGEHRDRLELRLQMGLERGYSARDSHASAGSVAALERVEELCAGLGEVPEQFQVTLALWRMHHVQSESLIARPLAERCLRIADEKGDIEMQVLAHEALATTLGQLGEHALAHHHFQQGLALYNPSQDHDGEEPGISLPALDSHQLARMGLFDQARRMADLALARTRQSGQHSNHAFGLWIVTLLYRHFLDFDRVLALSSELLQYGDRYEVSQWRTNAVFEHGWALFQMGHRLEGLKEMNESEAAVRRLIPKYRIIDPDYAVALGKTGQAARGLAMMDEMLRYTERTGEHGRDVFTRRARGVLLLMLGKRDEAEAAFEEAIACAQQYKCLNHELLSTLALCRLWRDQGKPAPARDRLAAVYSRVTEGFDVSFMIEARELLTELRGM